ncbi:MAG: hypothetical protein V1816_20580 [Pseudomonadota bacterium]
MTRFQQISTVFTTMVYTTLAVKLPEIQKNSDWSFIIFLALFRTKVWFDDHANLNDSLSVVEKYLIVFDWIFFVIVAANFPNHKKFALVALISSFVLSILLLMIQKQKDFTNRFLIFNILYVYILLLMIKYSEMENLIHICTYGPKCRLPLNYEHVFHF